MSISECSAYREEIIQHFVDGTALSEVAREHYLSCVSCMAAVTARLSQNIPGVSEPRSNSRTHGNSDAEPETVPECASELWTTAGR